MAPPARKQDIVLKKDVPQTSSIWRLFDERAEGDIARRDPKADAIMEIKSYLEEPIIPRTEDPLSWWESKASLYPRLANVMLRKLCIVATSVPSEFFFLKQGKSSQRGETG